MVDESIFDETPFSLRNEKYINQYYLKYDSVEAREYQISLATKALDESSVIALPTGTGKTIISLLATAERVRQYEDSKVLFLAPLKPLVKQQAESFREHLDIPNSKIKVFTGDVRPQEREQLWDETKIVFATPQVIENDIISNRISLESVCYTVFDECHRATGDYSYTFIAEEYWNSANNPLVTGLSASPGSNKSKILNICQNLGATNLEVLSEEDDVLQEHLHETTVSGEFIDLPDEFIEAKNIIDSKFRDCTENLKENGYLSTVNPGYKQLLHGCRNSIQKDIENGNESDGYSAMSVYAEAIKLYELQEIIAKRGLTEVGEKIEEWREDVKSSSDSSKALQRVVSDSEIEKVYTMAVNFSGVHPKLKKLRVLLAESLMDGGNAIVFCEYVESVHRIVEFLEESNISAYAFVGQKGMTRKEQQNVLDKFRKGEFDVLVSTKVAEEGLDLPQVNRIIEYHPVASGLRKVQRAGRTGRDSSGEVFVLVNSDTMEEGLYYASLNNKSKMEDSLKELKKMRSDILDELRENQEYLRKHGVTKDEDTDDDPDNSKQVELTEIDPKEGEDKSVDTDVVDSSDSVHVIIDSREMNSSIGRQLHKSDSITVDMDQLDVGDYILGPDCAAERKSISDFLNTLTGGDRSLFEQLGDLANSYQKPILLLEGDSSQLYSGRVHKNAINGALASIQFDFGVNIVYTDSEDDTVNWIELIAEREQDDSESEVQAHGTKSTQTIKDQQEYIVSSFEGVGSKTAKKLLNQFNTIEDIINASSEDLQETDTVGPSTAEYIREVVEEKY